MAIKLEKFAYQRGYQISAPSDPQVIKLLKGMVKAQGDRRLFLSRTPDKQTFINAMILALDIFGPDFQDLLFDLGAAKLGPALQAGEPGMPGDVASRVHEVMRKAIEVSEPESTPLPKVRFHQVMDPSKVGPESSDVSRMNGQGETISDLPATDSPIDQP